MFHGKISAQIAEGLQELRKRIDAAKIPSSKLDETLNLCTWNIREFGRRRRSEAAIHYIAEILGQFDLISLVELRDDLTDLGRVLPILGPYWRAVYSDIIPDAGGNMERIGFLYDKRAVAFTGLAAAANPPRKKSGREYVPEFTWWRSPYMASFSAGNFDFVVATAHIRWGDSKEARTAEIRSFADWLDLKRRQKHVEDKDFIVTGDFNIESPAMYEALTSKGLVAPAALRKGAFGTNLARDKRYDQIVHYPIYSDSFMNKGGVLDFYTGGTEALFPGMGKDASPSNSPTTCRSGYRSIPTTTVISSTRSSGQSGTDGGVQRWRCRYAKSYWTRCSAQSTGTPRLTVCSDRVRGCRPSRIAVTISGASKVRRSVSFTQVRSSLSCLADGGGIFDHAPVDQFLPVERLAQGLEQRQVMPWFGHGRRSIGRGQQQLAYPAPLDRQGHEGHGSVAIDEFPGHAGALDVNPGLVHTTASSSRCSRTKGCCATSCTTPCQPLSRQMMSSPSSRRSIRSMSKRRIRCCSAGKSSPQITSRWRYATTTCASSIGSAVGTSRAALSTATAISGAARACFTCSSTTASISPAGTARVRLDPAPRRLSR